MDLEIKTMRYTSYFCLVALVISILTQSIKGDFVFSVNYLFRSYEINITNDWFKYISNFFLGLFCSGVFVFLVSIITAKYKFRNSVNRMLFYSKVARNNYDRILNADKKQFFVITQKIVDSFDDFYQCYTEIEFAFFNRYYEKSIRDLFIAFCSFVQPFISAIIKNEDHVIKNHEIGFFYAESQTMTKLSYYEFIYRYVDFYTLWDKKLLESVMDFNELGIESLFTNEKKPETIRQIIARRKRI